MVFDNSMVFFLKAVFAGLATILVIPKHLYKKYFLYGFVFGAIGNVIHILIMEPLLHMIKYYNMGSSNILNLFSFWTPIAWLFAFMLFFYFLPRRRNFLYPYLVGFAASAYSVGLMLQNFNVFRYIGLMNYIAPLTFLGWFSFSAWYFLRSEHIELK